MVSKAAVYTAGQLLPGDGFTTYYHQSTLKHGQLLSLDFCSQVTHAVCPSVNRRYCCDNGCHQDVIWLGTLLGFKTISFDNCLAKEEKKQKV